MIKDRGHLKKIVQEAFFQAIIGEVVAEENMPVYHYTSTDGLLGIITKQEIWFGNVDDLNDVTEIDYAFDQIIEPAILKCDSLTAEQKKRIQELIAIVRNRNFSLVQGDGVSACGINIFVLSTSKNGNSYTLWNNYTKNPSKAGFAVSMDNYSFSSAILKELEIRERTDDSSVKNWLFLGNVVYGRAKQEEIADRYVERLSYNLEGKGEEFQEIIYEAFVEGLLLLSLFMKDEEFSKEDEYRYVAVVADENTDLDVSRKPYLKFVNVGGNIMSRFVFPFDSKMISKIVVSPYMPDQEKVQQELQFLARKCNIPNVEIKINISKKIR